MDKRVAPTIILILVIFFILLQAGSLIFVLNKEGLGLLWTLILLITPLAIIITLVSVYIEKIKEIDEEERDDLSKY